MIWRFNKIPRHYWFKLKTNGKEVSRMMDWLGDKLDIRDLNDWYRTSLHSINKYVSGMDSVATLLQFVRISYPQHEWNMHLFHKRDKRTTQQRVLIALRSLF